MTPSFKLRWLCLSCTQHPRSALQSTATQLDLMTHSWRHCCCVLASQYRRAPSARMLGYTIQRGEQLTFDVDVVVELITVSLSSDSHQHTNNIKQATCYLETDYQYDFCSGDCMVECDPAAAQALKKWDGGRCRGGGGESGRVLNPSPVLGVRMLPPEIFWKYRCKSVQFDAFWGHQVIKSGTKNGRFSVPLLKVGWNLPSPPCRFRGPWCYLQKSGFRQAERCGVRYPMLIVFNNIIFY